MQPAELAEATRPERGQPQSDDAVVGGVGVSFDEPGHHRAVDEPDRAVMPQQQALGEVGHRGPLRFVMAANREEQLMVRGCDPDTRRLRLAPSLEASKAGAELEQSLVVLRRAAHGRRRPRVYRSTI